MSVTLYEPALRALLESQEGPVGRYVQSLAEDITLQAQLNVRYYFESAPMLDVDQDVDFIMEGSTATVGIRDAGNKSRRLARAQAEGKVNWLGAAVESVART
jgi:hypothetical protein